MTIEQLKDIERNNKVIRDLRSGNSRFTIYELKPFTSYILIHKTFGEYMDYCTAQSSLAICLKYSFPIYN
jgi:hypothetical protein